MSSIEKKARRKFTSEFKDQAVKRVLAGHSGGAGVGDRRSHDGRLAPPTGTRTHRPFRPGQPVCFRGLPGSIGTPYYPQAC
jgi:hypothetical protein